MLSILWRKGSAAAILAVAMLSGCGPTRYAYFQPQRSTVSPLSQTLDKVTPEADTLVPQAVIISAVEPAESGSAPTTTAAEPLPQNGGVSPTRHRNPDSYHNQRFRRFFQSLPLGHVAPRTHTIDRNNTGRKTYKLALVALGIAVASFGSLFLASGGTLMWILSATLPLTATLLGAASLATIKRNQDRYRGKGWAMAAVMLGTGVLGLALVALAALSTSELISR